MNVAPKAVFAFVIVLLPLASTQTIDRVSIDHPYQVEFATLTAPPPPIARSLAQKFVVVNTLTKVYLYGTLGG
jgi:hypothetical protein